MPLYDSDPSKSQKASRRAASAQQASTSGTHGSGQAAKQNKRVKWKKLFGPLLSGKTDHTCHIQRTKSIARLFLTLGGAMR